METAPRDGTEFTARIVSRWNEQTVEVERCRFNPKTGLFETFVSEEGWQPDWADAPVEWR